MRCIAAKICQTNYNLNVLNDRHISAMWMRSRNETFIYWWKTRSAKMALSSNQREHSEFKWSFRKGQGWCDSRRSGIVPNIVMHNRLHCVHTESDWFLNLECIHYDHVEVARLQWCGLQCAESWIEININKSSIGVDINKTDRISSPD